MIYSLQIYFMLFMSYSFLGWYIEVILKFIQYKRFINIGFLIGPWLPIYGWGALLITITIPEVLRPYMGGMDKIVLKKNRKKEVFCKNTFFI